MSDYKDVNIEISEPDNDKEIEIEIDSGDRYISEYTNIYELKKWIDEQVKILNSKCKD